MIGTALQDLWFGFGVEGKVVITSVITFFPLLINSMAGYQSVDPDRIDLARSCNATRLQILLKIILPSSLPYIFAGLNIASVLAILGAIVGEFVGAPGPVPTMSSGTPSPVRSADATRTPPVNPAGKTGDDAFTDPSGL